MLFSVVVCIAFWGERGRRGRRGRGGVNYTWSCESNLRNRNCHFKQVMSIEEYLPYLHQLVDLGGKNEPSICHLAGGKNVEVS